MKKQFARYLPLDSKVEPAMWESAIKVVDSSALLNLYGYSIETTQTFLNLLEKSSPKVWLPWQVGFEFFENRVRVIGEAAEKYEAPLKAWGALDSSFKKFQHPELSKEDRQKLGEIKESIKKRQFAILNLLETDWILEKLENVLGGQVGTYPGDATIEEWKKEGEDRFKKLTPPGFCDMQKARRDGAENKPFGDLFIWKEILGKAIAEESDIILITDDRKEDWWHHNENDLQLPHPSLIQEFEKCSSKSFYAYTSERFLKVAGLIYNTSTERAVEEIVQKIEVPPPTDMSEQLKSAALIAERSRYNDLIQKRGALRAQLERVRVRRVRDFEDSKRRTADLTLLEMDLAGVAEEIEEVRDRMEAIMFDDGQ